MSRKQDVKDFINLARKVLSNFETEKRHAENNTYLSQEGREQEIKALKGRTDITLKELSNRAVTVLQAAIDVVNGIVKESVKRTGSADYQTAFSNAINVFSLIGNSLSKPDIQDTAEPFVGNPVAVETLKAALHKAGRKWEDDLFPHDTRKMTLTLLTDSVKGITDNFSTSRDYDGLSGTRSKLHWVEKAIDLMEDTLTSIEKVRGTDIPSMLMQNN